MDLILWVILVCAAALLFYFIASDKMPHGGGGIAALTVFHDWQPKDKQEAVEVIIDEKAGKRQFGLTNEEPDAGNEPQKGAERNIQ